MFVLITTLKVLAKTDRIIITLVPTLWC